MVARSDSGSEWNSTDYGHGGIGDQRSRYLDIVDMIPGYIGRFQDLLVLSPRHDGSVKVAQSPMADQASIKPPRKVRLIGHRATCGLNSNARRPTDVYPIPLKPIAIGTFWRSVSNPDGKPSVRLLVFDGKRGLKSK